MTALESANPPEAPGSWPEAFVVERGGGRLAAPLYVVGSDISVKVSTRDSGGAFAVMEDCTPAQMGPPLHLHREGQYLFEVDGREILAGPGSVVFAPAGSRHRFQNIGTTPGRSIVTVVPGGLDEFFKELSVAAPRGTVPDPARLIPLFEKHGLELLGPPLPPRP